MERAHLHNPAQFVKRDRPIPIFIQVLAGELNPAIRGTVTVPRLAPAAGAIAGVLGLVRSQEEAHPVGGRSSRRAGRAAIDLGGSHRVDELSVLAPISL